MRGIAIVIVVMLLTSCSTAEERRQKVRDSMHEAEQSASGTVLSMEARLESLVSAFAAFRLAMDRRIADFTQRAEKVQQGVEKVREGKELIEEGVAGE